MMRLSWLRGFSPSLALKCVFLFAAALLSTGCQTPLSKITKATDPEPVALQVPFVYRGADLLEKSEIFRYEKTAAEKNIPMVFPPTDDGQLPKIDKDELNLNRITQIYAGSLKKNGETEILVAGDTQAFILAPNGDVKKIDYKLGSYRDNGVQQEYRLPIVSIADVYGDGNKEIIGNGAEIGAIIDLQGKTRWKYTIKNRGEGPDAITVGDVDGDSKNEIIVSVKNRLEIFDLNGRAISQFLTSDYEYNSIYPDKLKVINFKDKPAILAADNVFDIKGNRLLSIKSPNILKGIRVTDSLEPQFLSFENGRLRALDIDGRRIAERAAPLSNLDRLDRKAKSGNTGMGYSAFRVQELPVRFSSDRQSYLVDLVSVNDPEEFDFFKMLYIYDDAGELVYHETLQAFDSEMCTLDKGDGSQRLLVTDDGKLNLYTAKE